MTAAITESAGHNAARDSAGGPPAEDPPGEPARRGKAVEAAGAAKRGRRSSWQVLGQRDFRRFFLGSLISNLGTWLQSTAQVLITYKVTHSVFMVGLIASAQFAGMILSPWAPVLATRFSPRAVLVGTQGFSALVAGFMAWRYYDGRLGVHSLIAGAFGLGFAFALALPVQTALVPALVPEEDAADAVKMNSVSYNAGRAMAPALCVPVILFVGPDLTFALNALSFVIFVIILRTLPRIASDVSFRRTFAFAFSRLRYVIGYRANRSRAVNPAGDRSSARPPARMRDGLVTALRRRRLLLLMAIIGAVTLGDDPILVLSPAIAARLHISSASAGYFIAALGWGSVLGSLLPTSAVDNNAQHASRNASRRAAVSLLVLGASVIVFASGLWFPASLVAAGAAGAAALFTGTAAQTALLRHQRKDSADVATVASVAALWAIAWAGTKPLASLLDGWLASRYGVIATCVILTFPAISIALCELSLSAKVKNRINMWSEGVASGIVSRLAPSAPVNAGRNPS